MNPQPEHADSPRPPGASGYRSLSRGWAKAELFLGLSAAGGGQVLATWAVVTAPLDVLTLLAGLALFVLGSYLALAGHRSHLYQSLNEQTRILADEIQQLREKVASHEHPR